VAADWDGAALREAQSAEAYEADAYDADPDAENYAAGMDPETVYRNQGSPDGAGGWGRYLAEAPETGGASEEADLWGGVDPDEANYADLDGPGEPESPREAEPVLDAERPLSPEQQRISKLEAKNAEFSERLAATEHELAESRQETAEARQDAAESKQDAAEAWQVATEAMQDAAESTRENAVLRAELGQTNARVDRLEQVVAVLARQPDQAALPERTDATSTGKHGSAIAEHEGTSDEAVAKDGKRFGWRSSTAIGENSEIAGTLVMAADNVAHLAAHVTMDGAVNVGAAVLVLGGLGLSKIGKRADETRKVKA